MKHFMNVTTIACSGWRAPRTVTTASRANRETGPKGAPLSEALRIHPNCSEGPACSQVGAPQDHWHSPPANPPVHTPITQYSTDSPQSLSQAAEALTDAMARPARSSPAPSVAHSSSSAQEHPSTGPRALAGPAPSTIGDGKGQHAPSLTESAGALTESARALTASAPLLMLLAQQPCKRVINSVE
jgi:hypothetical protein